MGLKSDKKENKDDDSSSEIVNKDEKKKADSYVSYFELFRYATCTEIIAIFVGIAAAAVNGGCMFWLIAAYGELNTMFVERTVRKGFTSTTTTFLKGAGGGVVLTNATSEQARDALLDDVKAYGFMMLGHTLATFFSGFITVHLINWAARRQITRIRLRFLESILKQEMEWFDTDANLNFATKMTDDLEKLKEGISEKLGIFMYHVLSSVILIITSFIWGWELTLACLAAVPIAIVTAGGISMLQSKWTVKEQAALSKAGSVAEEVFTAIRTVVAFGGEKKEVDRYKKLLLPVEKFGKWKGILTGAGTGVSWMLMYAVNVIGFVLGVRLVVWGWADGAHRYHPGVILTITYNVLMSAQNIALSAPHTETFAAARGAATDVFRILSRKSKINSLSKRGTIPKQKLGQVHMDDVHFNYPSRPDVRVLRGVTLRVQSGETVALVGASGCGKSTVLQLLQRLYDPILGTVNVHGMDVKGANLSALRKLNGVVGQEPVLFTGTIQENITCGEEYSSKEIEEAALIANAHHFITKLPDGYKTVLGSQGSSLSGGQKQRIAIARAVIRKPSLLLLDEPTSALDHHAEKNVQIALEKARQGRTTIVVSHRLSTIVNSSRIVCMDAGKIVEEGTHEELMEKKGFYHKLVTTTSEIKPLEPSPVEEEQNTDDEEKEPEVLQRKLTARRSSRRPHRTSSIRRDSVAWSRRTSAVSLASNIEYPYVEVGLLDEEEPEDELEKPEKMSEWQFLKLSAPEWPLIAVGSLAALLQGGSFPAFSILFSYVFGLFSLNDHSDIISQADHYSGLLFLGSVCAGVAMFIQSASLTCAGARLTTRLRVEAFTNYLRQEMSFFDSPQNTVGALCSRLGGDAGCLAGAAGARLGLVLLGGSALLTGAILAAAHEYRMALVGLCFVPPIVIGMWAEGRAARTGAEKERECMDQATDIATEAIRAIRTVHSLGTEKWVLKRYSKAVLDGAKASSSRGRWRGFVYGAGLASPCLCYNVSLIYGGILIANNEMSYQKALLVVEALMNGAFMLGQALVFAPNFARAMDSAAAVIAHVRRMPTLTSYRGLSDNPKWKSTGNVDMKNLEFTYPTRTQRPVLRDLSLKVNSGSRVALVGASGCGKSTLVQLLLRFYDPFSGAIQLDRRELRRCITLTTLRQQFGLVQQEPVLFDRSIGENIAYGACDRRVNISQVVAAAKAANIHSFITSLPQGYETQLGPGGASLSGGQKQRIAIARALLREPALLLLDEATSALDVASEKAVTEALRAASSGRTTVVVAHRLTTVQDADLICVIHKGRIAECGTHDELIKEGGLYYNMYQTQAIAT